MSSARYYFSTDHTSLAYAPLNDVFSRVRAYYYCVDSNLFYATIYLADAQMLPRMLDRLVTTSVR